MYLVERLSARATSMIVAAYSNRMRARTFFTRYFSGGDEKQIQVCIMGDHIFAITRSRVNDSR